MSDTNHISGKRALLNVLAVVVFVFLLAALLLPTGGSRKIAKNIKARLDEDAAATALKAYLTTYGNLPVGDAESVERILSGEDLSGKNPQKIRFLNFKRSDEHPNEMVDPWGILYEIKFEVQTNFVIRSAGQDGKFGSKDDIIFNSISNDFVTP